MKAFAILKPLVSYNETFPPSIRDWSQPAQYFQSIFGLKGKKLKAPNKTHPLQKENTRATTIWSPQSSKVPLDPLKKNLQPL